MNRTMDVAMMDEAEAVESLLLPEKSKESYMMDDIPKEIIMEAEAVESLLIPEKSKESYEKEYIKFCNWRKGKDVTRINKAVLLVYMSELSKVFAASSLWCTYSKLKTMLRVREKVDVSSFSNVVSFLKKLSVMHVPKKSNVLSRYEIDEFLLRAPDDAFLLIKFVMAFGACRRRELHDLCINDVKVEGSVLVVHTVETKNYKPRSFTIVPDGGVVNCVALFEKYVALRPKNVKCKNLFLYYKGGKCTSQPVGINSFGKFPMEIAKFLKLPNPSVYTDHCCRRSSATILANSVASLTEVKRLGGWKSGNVAESYIEECIESKIRTAKKITIGKADENLVEVRASTSSGITISNVQNCTFNIYPEK